MGDVENISSDTVIGMDPIAAYTGLPKRKAYHLATNGQLPGAFRLGKSWGLIKSVYAAEIRSRATAGTAQRSA